MYIYLFVCIHFLTFQSHGYNIFYVTPKKYSFNFVIWQDLEPQRRRDFVDSATDSRLPLPEDADDVDIADYKFSKFAATHFQNNATPTHIRRALKQPLLPLKNEGDQLVSKLFSFLTHCFILFSKLDIAEGHLNMM